MSDNSHLNRAKITRDDEFYTPASAVHSLLDMTLAEDSDAYRGRCILCSCDHPGSSMFPEVIAGRHGGLMFSRLVATGFPPGGEPPALLDWSPDSGRPWRDSVVPLDSPSGFDSPLQVSLVDSLAGSRPVVVTNPPFSLISSRLLPFLEAFSLDYQLIVPFTTVHRLAQGIASGSVHARDFRQRYLRPDGSTVGINTALVSTLRLPPPPALPLPSLSSLPPMEVDPVFGRLLVPSLASLPGDYDGEMLVPLTYLLYHDARTSPFEIVDCDGGLDGSMDYISTFLRVCIRRAGPA